MTVSARCTSLNLLNHCKQVHKPSSIEYTFIQRKHFKGPNIKSDYFAYPDSWICTFNIENNVYYSCNTTKKQALEDVLVNTEDILKTYL